MQLTREQEAELMEDNMPKIYRAVDNYMARCTSQVVRIPYEDMVQEVSIAFLNYIRRCESMESVEKFPWYDATHAMSELVLRCQPLSVPNCTKRFSEVIHSLPDTVSLEVIMSNGVAVDGMSKHWVDDKDTQLDFEAFMASQTEYTNRIASMRIFGMNMKEIASQCGISRQSVYKKMKKLREDYDEFTGGDQNDR